jgi:hypothetical protein
MYTEETAPPGLWKSEVFGLLGVWVIGSAFVLPPGTAFFYNNLFVGLVAGNVALAMAGNRKWERPAASAAAIWLVISAFVPSVLSGTALYVNQVGVGAVLALSAISANVHLRDDIRHGRPLTM